MKNFFGTRIFFLILFFLHCSSSNNSKYVITSVNLKNPQNSINQCKEILSKRVYFFPYVIPLNSIKGNELKSTTENTSLRFSQGLTGLDLFYTIAGAAFGLIVQTQTIESCDIQIAEKKAEKKEKKSCYYDRNFKKIFCIDNSYYDPETNYYIGVFERLFMLY